MRIGWRLDLAGEPANSAHRIMFEKQRLYIFDFLCRRADMYLNGVVLWKRFSGGLKRRVHFEDTVFLNGDFDVLEVCYIFS